MFSGDKFLWTIPWEFKKASPWRTSKAMHLMSFQLEKNNFEIFVIWHSFNNDRNTYRSCRALLCDSKNIHTPPPHPHGVFFGWHPIPFPHSFGNSKLATYMYLSLKMFAFATPSPYPPIPLGISTDPLCGEVWIFSGIASSWYNNSLQLVVSEVCIVECSKRLWVFHN